MNRHIRPLIDLALVAALTATTALAAGCSSEPNELELGPDGPRGHAELLYMIEKVKQSGGETIHVDLTDEVQYRFVRDRLQAAGKTPDTAPKLYEDLDTLWTQQLSDAAGAVQGDHFVSDFLGFVDSSQFEAGAFAMTVSPSDYSYVDVMVRDKEYRGLAGSWDEGFGAGRQLSARTAGSLGNLADQTHVDSLNFTAQGGLVTVTYTVLSNVVPVSLASEEERPLRAIGATLSQPLDNDNNGIITICLNRGHDDCDYESSNGRVEFPLEGTMTFPQAFSEVIGVRDSTFVKLVSSVNDTDVMPNGCGVAGAPAMCNFSDNVFNTFDRKGVNWNFTTADFGNQIPFKSGQTLNMFLRVTTIPDCTPSDPPCAPTMVGAISSTATLQDGLRTNLLVPPFEVLYSCLAAGTQIAMGDGTTMNVEDVAEGASVVTDMSNHPFEVVDTSIGVETIPMVRIEDERGRTLLMTETHPVVTPDRGIVWASELAVGDPIMTDTGPSQLVRVEREPYDGHVYNLELDRGADPFAAASPIQGSTLYANGFVVGDLAMQSAFEFSKRADPRSEFERVPAAWRADYRNSPKRN